MKAIALEYHDVVGDGDLESSGFPGGSAGTYKLDASLFARHLDAIGEAAPRGLATATELLGGGFLEGRPVLITFDDGGIGAHTQAAGHLERHGWRGHFFVTVDRIGSRGFLGEKEIRDLHGRGHVIGSHSCSHPHLMAQLPYDAILREWQRSTLVLSEIVGEPVVTASIPGGLYSRQVAVAAARSGVKLLFNSEPVIRCREVEGCLVVGRFTARRWTTPERAAALAAGRLGPRLREWAVRAVLTNARRLGGGVYLRARSVVLDRR
jgi:peptidoglycan/xylan/chitin deacetylase (PgdA/CDA1 family)